MYKILIVGKGSAGKNHFNALRKIRQNFLIKFISSRNFIKKFGKNYEQIKIFNPNYLIVSAPSTHHLKFIRIFEKIFKNKTILIEKPLFDKSRTKLKKMKNRYFVGYNMRHHPVLRFIKKYIKGKKIFFVNSECFTYLPDWRISDYRKTVSAQKKLGGGVLLELSHEIDYLIWLLGNFKIQYSFNKKISNLKINCDDILCLNAVSNKKVIINLNLNFFSRIEKRQVLINGKDFSLLGDLRKNIITLVEKHKKRFVNFKNYKISKSYKKENLDLIKRNYLTNCTLREAMNVQKTIEKIRLFV
tara:strand:- start:1889 stop:2791 length:903 start_codon:yes stop_codon:yes gene_type:complete